MDAVAAVFLDCVVVQVSEDGIGLEGAGPGKSGAPAKGADHKARQSGAERGAARSGSGKAAKSGKSGKAAASGKGRR